MIIQMISKPLITLTVFKSGLRVLISFDSNDCGIFNGSAYRTLKIL